MMEFGDKGSDVENLAPNEVVVTSELQDLKNLCTQFGLSTFGPRNAIIKRLVKQGILKPSDYSLDGGSFSVKGGRKQSVPTKSSKDADKGTQITKNKPKDSQDALPRQISKNASNSQSLPSDKGIDEDRTKEKSSAKDTDSDSSVECLDISDDECDSGVKERKKPGPTVIATQILFSKHFDPTDVPSDDDDHDLSKDDSQMGEHCDEKEGVKEEEESHMDEDSNEREDLNEEVSEIDEDSDEIQEESPDESSDVNVDLCQDEGNKQAQSSDIHKQSTSTCKKNKEVWITSKKSEPKVNTDTRTLERNKEPVKKKPQMFVSDTMASLMDLMNYGDDESDDDNTKEDMNIDRTDESDSDESLKSINWSNEKSFMERCQEKMDCNSETKTGKVHDSCEEAEENSRESHDESDEKSEDSLSEHESTSESDHYTTADNSTPDNRDESDKVYFQGNTGTNNFFAFGSFVTATGSAEKVNFAKDDEKVEQPFVPFGTFLTSSGSPEVVKFKLDSKKESETPQSGNMVLDPKLGKWVNCPVDHEDEKVPPDLEKVDYDVLELSDDKRIVERIPVRIGLCPGVVFIDQSIVNFSNNSENDDKMMNILSILENDHKQFCKITRTGGDLIEEVKDPTPIKKETKETVVVLNKNKKSKKSKSKTGNNNFVAWGTFEDASGGAEKVQFISK